MQDHQPNSAEFSVATKLEAPAHVGETLSASAGMLAATAGSASSPSRDWATLTEEDSSFFVPERCTALDDF